MGKIAIPDSILLKRGSLTATEWDTMKTHARIGGDVIRRAIEKTLDVAILGSHDGKPESLAFLEVAAIIAETHHERWDGSGYPDGLAGADIPLPGRLMALADAYDALGTPRVYKDPWPLDRAAGLILEEKGSHFDPDVVDAFAAARHEFEAVHHQLADADGGEEAAAQSEGEPR